LLEDDLDMEIPLLNDIIIIFGLSIVVLLFCHRFRLPTIVGFLLTGILAGPFGFGLIKGVHEVEILAEIGIVLLLFTIGIEFSLDRLLQIRRSVLMGGSIQVLLTVLASYFIARHTGKPIGESVFIGFLISLSSTAIVLKVIQERSEVDSPHGSTTLGILIFQDVIIVPMILVTPLLAGTTRIAGGSFLILLLKGMGIIGLVFVSAKWLVPQILYRIAQTRSRELFLLSVVVICLAVAWLTSNAGLSLALGAFLAGLIISESEYSNQALGHILPFRDVFISFFFVSIGMLLDLDFLLHHPLEIALIVSGVVVLKSIIATSASVFLGFPLRTAILTGLALCQIGEFSFILSRTGVDHGLLAGNIYQAFLAVSVLSMAVTPFIMVLAPRIADTVLRLPLPERLVSGFHPVSGLKVEGKKDHLVIIGFGVNGRNIALTAKAADIPYVIIEMNPETVRKEQARGEPIYFGDATHEAVLQNVNIKSARVAVIVINDPAATRRITELIRRLNTGVYLIVRTRYIHELKPLYDLGADEVIPAEFETSVEIFARVLTRYLIPRDEIEKLVSEVRSDGYEMFRRLSRESTSFTDFRFQLPDVEISALRIAEGSPLVGKSLAETGMRKRYGVTVLAVRRNSEVLSSPDVNMPFRANDLLIILGSPERIADVANLFRANEKER
jgi:CPA2 family monovalent cation:H+ antiporter-2